MMFYQVVPIVRMDCSRNPIKGFAASSKLGLPRVRSGVDGLGDNENGVLLCALSRVR